MPDNVQVISLENKHDIVPHLDGADNPHSVNRTTVTVDSQRGSVGDNHDIALVYVPAAAAADRSGDSSVRAYVDSAKSFTDGTSASTHIYKVRHLTGSDDKVGK